MKQAGRERLGEFKQHIQDLNNATTLYEWVQPANTETIFVQVANGVATPGSQNTSTRGLYERARAPSFASSSSSLPAPAPMSQHQAFNQLEEGFKAQLSVVWQSVIAKINNALSSNDALPLLRHIFLYIDSNSDLDLFYSEMEPAYRDLQLLPHPLRDKIKNELDQCIRKLFVSSEASDFIEENEHPKKHQWLGKFIEEQRKHDELRKLDDMAFASALDEVVAEASVNGDGASTRTVSEPQLIRQWTQARRESYRIGRASGDYRHGMIDFAFKTLDSVAASYESTGEKVPMTVTNIHSLQPEEINGQRYLHSHQAIHTYLPVVKLPDELRDEFLSERANSEIPSFFEKGYYIDADLTEEVQIHLDKIKLKLIDHTRGSVYQKLKHKELFLEAVITLSQERRLSPRALHESIKNAEVFSATFSSVTRKLYMKVHTQIYKQAWNKACEFNDVFPGLKLSPNLVAKLKERYNSFKEYEGSDFAERPPTSLARWRHDKCLLYKPLFEAAEKNTLRPKLVEELPSTLPCYNARSLSYFRSSATEKDYLLVREEHHRDVWVAMGGEGEKPRLELKFQQGRTSIPS